MPASVHDNVLVAYEVLCEERKIVLHAEFRERKPPERTTVVFTGVEAYHFKDDTLGSIILDVEPVEVADLLTAHRVEILESSRFTGWPWAKDLDAAPDVLAGMGVSGFVLSASYGMTGWVLARAAAIAGTTAVGSSASPSRRGVYGLAADGSRTWLDATGVVIGFGDGRRLVVSLSSHAASRAGVELRSEYEGPDEGASGRRGAPEEAYAAITLLPGGGNVVQASVTARRTQTGEVIAGGGEAVPGARSYALVRRDEEVATREGAFLFDCGEGRVLQVDSPRLHGVSSETVSFLAGPPPSLEDLERFQAGGPHITSGLAVRFGGCNVVFLDVSPPYAAQPFQRLSRRPDAR